MAKHPHLSLVPDPVQPSGPAPAYEIGYGRPPAHTRVKPGQVLNPRGRPKGQRNVSMVLRKALNERTKIREGNRTRSVTKLNAIILKMINDAGLGNAKARASLIDLMRSAGLFGADEPRNQGPLTIDDQAVIAEFLERNGSKAKATEPSESHEPLRTEHGKGKETKS